MSRRLTVVGYYAMLLVCWYVLYWIGTAVAGVILAVIIPFAHGNVSVCGLVTIACAYAAVNVALYGKSLYRTGALDPKLAYPENGWQ